MEPIERENAVGTLIIGAVMAVTLSPYIILAVYLMLAFCTDATSAFTG